MIKAFLVTHICILMAGFLAPDNGAAPTEAAKTLARVLRLGMLGWAICVLVTM